MTIISADNRFEWDSEKNDINIKKHGLSFEEILPLFDDPFSWNAMIHCIQAQQKIGSSVLEV